MHVYKQRWQFQPTDMKTGQSRLGFIDIKVKRAEFRKSTKAERSQMDILS